MMTVLFLCFTASVAAATHGLDQAINSLTQQNRNYPLASLRLLDRTSQDIAAAIVKQIEKINSADHGSHFSESTQAPPSSPDGSCADVNDSTLNHRELGLKQKADGNQACAAQHFAAHVKLMKIEVNKYGDADAHYDHATALMEGNSLDLAVESYKQAVALAPDDQDAYDALIESQFMVLIASEDPDDQLDTTLPAMSQDLESVVHGEHCQILHKLLSGTDLKSFFTEHYEKKPYHFKGSLERGLPVDSIKSKHIVESLRRDQNRYNYYTSVCAHFKNYACFCAVTWIGQAN
jgi:hypothetical protein